ncbi:hypothetical protein [Loigolactobacillus binensis]|uniref:Histidine kinase n=1 Tax=Loigolactobacillus binensis TaxID=2559922 RepID=A0ABW3EID6_9LACO|nr:hypothetical protein [Loigolactobacillus binensis]
MGVWADWIQAIGVVVSLAIAGIRYYQIKRSTALEAIEQMLNLADEFHLLLDDEFRYKVVQSQNEIDESKRLRIDYNYMQQEITGFEQEFRGDLKDLWSKLALASPILFRHKYEANVRNTLNNATNIRRKLKTLINYLQQENRDQIQQHKNEVVKLLIAFAENLSQLAVAEKLIRDKTALTELFSSLTDYHDINKRIVAEVGAYVADMETPATFLYRFWKNENELSWINSADGVVINPRERELHAKLYPNDKELAIRKEIIRDALKSYSLLEQSESTKFTFSKDKDNGFFVLTKKVTPATAQ